MAIFLQTAGVETVRKGSQKPIGTQRSRYHCVQRQGQSGDVVLYRRQGISQSNRQYPIPHNHLKVYGECTREIVSGCA